MVSLFSFSLKGRDTEKQRKNFQLLAHSADSHRNQGWVQAQAKSQEFQPSFPRRWQRPKPMPARITLELERRHSDTRWGHHKQGPNHHPKC